MTSARYALAGATGFAGLMHFVRPLPFVQHIPPWVPGRELLVYASGAIEIALGLALVALPSQRRNVGRALALFFIVVFPANVYVAVADVDVDGLPGGAYRWVRLPFQFLLIAWALWCTRTPADEDPAP